MERYTQQTLEQVRGIVARVQERDLANVQPEDKLNLDSINRIALIAELENDFGIELSEDDVQPEVFETLDSLAALIEARRA